MSYQVFMYIILVLHDQIYFIAFTQYSFLLRNYVRIHKTDMLEKTDCGRDTHTCTHMHLAREQDPEVCKLTIHVPQLSFHNKGYEFLRKYMTYPPQSII